MKNEIEKGYFNTCRDLCFLLAIVIYECLFDHSCTTRVNGFWEIIVFALSILFVLFVTERSPSKVQKKYSFIWPAVYWISLIVAVEYPFGRLGNIIGIVMLVADFFIAVLIIARKIDYRRYRQEYRRRVKWKIIRKRLRLTVMMVLNFTVLYVSVCTLIMPILAVTKKQSVEISESLLISSDDIDEDEAYFVFSDDELEGIKNWEFLSNEARLDMLISLCKKELAFLGIVNFSLGLRSEQLEEPQLGYYSPESRYIAIDICHLEKDSFEDVLNTLIHEIRHVYQNNLAQVYELLTEDQKQLRYFYSAKIYAESLADYIDYRDEPTGYMYQSTEIDARIYANSRVKEYLDKIEEEMNER